MNSNRLFRGISVLILASMLLSACQSAPASAGQPSAAPQTTDTPAPTAAPTATNTPEPSATPEPSPTPDVRLNPDDWMNWPIIPTFSARTREIYQQGLALGTNPNAFSKVGDCQMINEAFFGIYALPGQYGFPDGDEYLQDTIDYYDGMFGRLSTAVSAGFTAPSILSPLWADPQLCEQGESPLECEFRRNNPSVILIGLEFWFKGRTSDSYAQYVRQIVDFAIERGVVPILITKADNVEGDNSINRATAQIAYDYDIPLWNFWRAAQALPNQGMDMERNDGFHISVAGWNERSFTGLEVLDAFRKDMAESQP